LIYYFNLGDKDVAGDVRKLLDQIDVIDRGYFGKDRQKSIKSIMDEALRLLDQKPIDLIQNKKEKADMLYLRGKTLDYNPEYTKLAIPSSQKLAEENLSKSIKLMPTKKEAWDALGHVYWKKQDLHQSKKCFEGSLEQDDKN
jgi:tetratricopeptide (TPR) repeat protein